MLSVLFVALVLASCSDTENPVPSADLVLDTASVTLAPNSSASVSIRSGNGGYSVVSSNEAIVQASVEEDVVTIHAISHVELGEVLVVVTDRTYQRAYLSVTVADIAALQLDRESVSLDAVQASGRIAIIQGNGDYNVTVTEPTIAKAIVKNDTVVVTGKRNGTTEVVVEDGKGQRASVALVVDGPAYAMNFGDQYFTYANFRDIAVVDRSVTECKQVTWELTCKMDGYRGLQTFLGLEGNLIVRGKNDDYRPTHPIQIAGLGDRIMLESTSSFNLNEWLHIALVVDCTQDDVSDKYKLYINGIQDELIVQRQDETHSVVNLASSADGDRFEIGRAFGQDWRVIRGAVAEARVWTVARTAEQIGDNLCTLVEEQPTGLLARWEFAAGAPTNYIQDINGGKYETDMFIANAKINGNYTPITAPESVFVPRGCVNE